MLKTSHWTIAVAALVVLGVVSPGLAQTPALQAQQIALKEAVCRQNWDQAIQLTTALLGSPDISASYHAEMIMLSPQLVGLRDAKAILPSVPGCEGVPVTNTPARVDWGQAQSDINAGKYRVGDNPVTSIYDGTGFSSGGGFPSSGSGGACSTPGQRDSIGRRCGGRAASERPGGK